MWAMPWAAGSGAKRHLCLQVLAAAEGLDCLLVAGGHDALTFWEVLTANPETTDAPSPLGACLCPSVLPLPPLPRPLPPPVGALALASVEVLVVEALDSELDLFFFLFAWSATVSFSSTATSSIFSNICVKCSYR